MVKDIDVASHAHDSVPFIVENNIDNVNSYLERASGALFNRFKKNNVDKCHALVTMKKFVSIKIWDYTIDNSECEKLLGVKIDINLNFNDHISG